MLLGKGYKRFSIIVLIITLLSTLLMQPEPALADTQPPVISPSGGTFTSAQSVTISNIPNGDAAFYTIDGSDPTTSSTSIVYNGTFTVSESETVRAAVNDTITGWSAVSSAVFVINTPDTVEPPVISPNGGTFTSEQSVTISNVPDADNAYYTIDGSNPTSSTTAVPYTDAFTVSQSGTVKAAIHDNADGWSAVVSADFVINTPDTVEAPVISPNGGTFTCAQSVTISNVSNGDVVYYTTDGSSPTGSTTAVPYTGAFTVSQSGTVKAAAHDTAAGWSTVASAVFVIDDSDEEPGSSDQIAQLKQQFAAAISNNQFSEAAKILQRIQALVKQGSCDDKLNKFKEQVIDAVNDNNWAKAEALLKQIIKLEDSDWAYSQLGQIYEQEGNTNINVFSNGDQVNFDEQPIVVNGRTLIPIRKIANALGISDNSVSWDSNGTVIIKNGKDKITIQNNVQQVYLNGKSYATDVPAQIHNGRMMVPLRAVSELFHKKVQWYPQGKIVKIK